MESDTLDIHTTLQPEWLDRFIGINDLLLVEVQARKPEQKVVCKILKTYSTLYENVALYKTGFIEFVYTAGTYGYSALDARQIAVVPVRALPSGGLYENFHPRHFRVIEIDDHQRAVWYGKIEKDDSYFPEVIRTSAVTWEQKPQFSTIMFPILEEYIKHRIPIVHAFHSKLIAREIAKLTVFKKS